MNALQMTDPLHRPSDTPHHEQIPSQRPQTLSDHDRRRSRSSSSPPTAPAPKPTSPAASSTPRRSPRPVPQTPSRRPSPTRSREPAMQAFGQRDVALRLREARRAGPVRPRRRPQRRRVQGDLPFLHRTQQTELHRRQRRLGMLHRQQHQQALVITELPILRIGEISDRQQRPERIHHSMGDRMVDPRRRRRPRRHHVSNAKPDHQQFIDDNPQADNAILGHP